MPLAGGWKPKHDRLGRFTGGAGVSPRGKISMGPPAGAAKARKLTAGQISGMGPDEVAQAHAEGRVTAGVAAKHIRNHAQFAANHAAIRGADTGPRFGGLSGQAPANLEAAERGRARAAKLRAMADEIEAKPPPPRKPQPRAAYQLPANLPTVSLADLAEHRATIFRGRRKDRRTMLDVIDAEMHRRGTVSTDGWKIAAAKVTRAKAEPKAPRPSGLPADRRPVSGDFEDLAGRVEGKPEAQILATIQDLNATELASLARKFPGGALLIPGWLKVSERRQGLKLPAGLSLDEQRRWLAQTLSTRRGLAWR